MGHMVKSTEVMGAMNRLVKVGDIRNTMQAMQKEMMKVRATIYPLSAPPHAHPHPRRRPLCDGAAPSRARRPHAACLTPPASSPALRRA